MSLQKYITINNNIQIIIIIYELKLVIIVKVIDLLWMIIHMLSKNNLNNCIWLLLKINIYINIRIAS
jgi:hypothetical protein